jgi:hypothetical protein
MKKIVLVLSLILMSSSVLAKTKTEAAKKVKFQRAPASWALNPEYTKAKPLSQGEEMLKDTSSLKPVDAKPYTRSTLVGFCETPYGMRYGSSTDAQNYSRCMDDPNRQAGGAALFTLPH